MPGTVNIFGILSHDRQRRAVPEVPACPGWHPHTSKHPADQDQLNNQTPCPSGYPFALKVQVPPISKEELELQLHKLRKREWCLRMGRRLSPAPLDPSLKVVFDEWFQLLDANQSGAVEHSEVVESMQLAQMPYQDQAVAEMLALLDYDKNGKIDWSEFKHFLNSEVASGKDVLNSEFVLPSGRTLPLGPVLALMRRKKMMGDIMNADGELRAEWASRSTQVLEAITAQRQDLQKIALQEEALRLRDLRRNITLRAKRDSDALSEADRAPDRRSLNGGAAGTRSQDARGSPLHSPRGAAPAFGGNLTTPRTPLRLSCAGAVALAAAALSPRAMSARGGADKGGCRATPEGAVQQQQGDPNPYSNYKGLSPWTHEEAEGSGPPEHEVLMEHMDRMLLAYELRMLGKQVPLPAPKLAAQQPRPASAPHRSLAVQLAQPATDSSRLSRQAPSRQQQQQQHEQWGSSARPGSNWQQAPGATTSMHRSSGISSTCITQASMRASLGEATQAAALPAAPSGLEVCNSSTCQQAAAQLVSEAATAPAGSERQACNSVCGASARSPSLRTRPATAQPRVPSRLILGSTGLNQDQPLSPAQACLVALAREACRESLASSPHGAQHGRARTTQPSCSSAVNRAPWQHSPALGGSTQSTLTCKQQCWNGQPSSTQQQPPQQAASRAASAAGSEAMPHAPPMQIRPRAASAHPARSAPPTSEIGRFLATCGARDSSQCLPRALQPAACSPKELAACGSSTGAVTTPAKHSAAAQAANLEECTEVDSLFEEAVLQSTHVQEEAAAHPLAGALHAAEPPAASMGCTASSSCDHAPQNMALTCQPRGEVEVSNAAAGCLHHLDMGVAPQVAVPASLRQAAATEVICRMMARSRPSASEISHAMAARML